MYKPESILENRTHKKCLDLKIKTDELIPATRSDLVLIKKKIMIKEACSLYIHIYSFCVGVP